MEENPIGMQPNLAETAGESVAEKTTEERRKRPEDSDEALRAEIASHLGGGDTPLLRASIDEILRRLALPLEENSPEEIAMDQEVNGEERRELLKDEWQELLASGDERAAEYLRTHPAPIVLPKDSPEGRTETIRFEQMVERFKAEHPLEALTSIVDLDPKDAPEHPIREPARKALIPIVESLNRLKGSTDYERLREEYMVLSRAVGMISGGKVDHER